MLKSHSIIRAPTQLLDLQKFFLAEVETPEQKLPPIELPFYNFVCYIVQILNLYAKSNLDVNLNIFLVDYHFKKYDSSAQLQRRFIGFINSWKKHSDTDECKLFLSFLKQGRNQKQSVKLFLKLRKILLKNINQKVLQQISLTHQDAVTIVHTMTIISPEQRKCLNKKINEYFITKNVKYVNNAKFNAAIICQYFMHELYDCTLPEEFNTNLSNKIAKILKDQPKQIQQFDEESISMKDMSFSQDLLENEADSKINAHSISSSSDKQNSYDGGDEKHKKSLVNLQRCMQELNYLKEKDLQIDNRFRKLNKGKK